MLRKKSIIMLFVIIAQISSVVQGAQSFVRWSAQDRYKRLLMEQGLKDPMQYNDQIAQISYEVRKQNFETLLKNAQQTGLLFQCQQLLTKPGSLINDFIKPEHLQVIAYMQNKYGNGNPFVYSGGDNSADLSQSAVLGSYTNPSGQVLTITRYSFFNTLLEALEKLQFDPNLKYVHEMNPYFNQMRDTINNNLATAVEMAKKPVQDPKVKLADLLKKFNEYAQKRIEMNATGAINMLIQGIEETLNKANFGRKY